MSDQIHPVSSAHHQAATPTPGPLNETSRANFSSPTTANDAVPSTTTAATTTTASQHAPMTTGTAQMTQTAPPPDTMAVPPPATEEPQTINMLLNNADRYWKFKSALQTITIITGLIGIGTFGWSMATLPKYAFVFGYDSTSSLWPGLLTFTCSVMWCAACIAVFQFRKRPVHPGLRVAMDLIIWLGFIFTCLFAILTYLNLAQWGEYGNMSSYGYGYSSRYGDYELLTNGTWVWEQDSDSTSYTRECDPTARTSRSSSYEFVFANCAEQDAYINQLWAQKPHRQGVELTGVVCQFLGLVLHFALFVWACVDCHHHNSRKVSKDAEKLAANIVQTMITNGAIIPPPRQAHMQPYGQQQMGYYQLPQSQQGQAYPMATMYPQRIPAGQPAPHEYRAPQSMVGPASGVVEPNDEKSGGPRYA